MVEKFNPPRSTSILKIPKEAAKADREMDGNFMDGNLMAGLVGTFPASDPGQRHPAGHRVLKNNTQRRTILEKLGEQFCERKTNRRVPSVYHGLSGTKRERLIS